MIEAKNWLPADTPVPRALDMLVGETVAGWGAAWFRATQPLAQSLSRRARGDFAWRSLDAGPMLGLAGDGIAAIGAAVLDLAIADRPDTDRAVLESVAEDCLADLRQRLAAMSGRSGAAGWNASFAAPTHMATIKVTTSYPLAIGFTDDMFARFARNVLPEQSQEALGDGVAALAALPVEVSATLGGVRLTIAELQALGIGDVIVLDHGIDAPIRLAVGGVCLPAGSCSIRTAAPTPCLQIIEPVA